jgi:hypothetical protein
MMIHTLSFCFILTAAVLLSCQDNGHAHEQEKVPQNSSPSMNVALPPDFSITLTKDEGMLPVYSTLFISAEACFFKEKDHQVERHTPFKLSPEQLNRIWQTLQDNDFERIESEEQNVTDRGGISISVQHNGKNTTLDNSGMHVLKDKWRKPFYEIVRVIEEVSRAALRKKKVDVQINIHPSIISGYDLEVFVRGGGVYNSEKESKKGSLAMDLLPGDYMMSVVLYEKNGPGSSRNTLLRTTMPFSVGEAKEQTFTLKYVDGKLRLE